jgi:regulator of sigma E protease
MSILLFFIVLFVLVLVHEWGHFIAAKKTGMRVDEFGIGFPPKMFGLKKGETEYTFNLLPIGGFVRIFGENKEELDSGEVNSDSDRAFSSRPKWAQIVVLLAGVFMNVVFAWFLFTLVLLIGVPSAVDESTAGPDAELYVAGVLADSPADGVLPVGSAITSVAANGETLEDPLPSEFSAFIAATAPEAVTVTYNSGDAVETVEITPAQGISSDDPDRYLIGTSLSLVETVERPFLIAVRDGLISTIEGLTAITIGLWTLLSDALFADADFSNIAGPVGIVGMVGDAADFGFAALLTFTAIISLNLAVINLLPFPALDGGRLVFVILEAITGKEIPPEWAGRINGIGFLLLLLLMVVVTYNDILRLL